MRPTPMHCTPEEINNMVDRGLLPQGTTPLFDKPSEPKGDEHPTASWLYRKFRLGSAILLKDEAYRIGNQLDALAARVRELEDGIAEVRRNVRSSLESLS